MAWDRYRSGRNNDDDRDENRWRSDENRGQFGYEGEGYLGGRGRDVERDLQRSDAERWNRDDLDREYGRSDLRSSERVDDRGERYGRDTSRGRYTTSFSGGGYGTGDRNGGDRLSRNANGRDSSGGYGYGSGGGSYDADRDYGSDAGYRGSGFMGGDYSGSASNNPPYRGQDFRGDMPERSDRYDYDQSRLRDDRGRDFSDYDRGSMGRSYGGDMARQERPSFRGRGPKGYQRSDERIREDVCERLAHDHDVDATDLDVTVAGGIVTLSGRVSDRDQKRRAEDIVERTGGVKDVENNIRVERGDHEYGSIFGNRPGAAAAAATAAASNTEGRTGATEDVSSGAAGTTVTGSPTTTSNKSRSK